MKRFKLGRVHGETPWQPHLHRLRTSLTAGSGCGFGSGAPRGEEAAGDDGGEAMTARQREFSDRSAGESFFFLGVARARRGFGRRAGQGPGKKAWLLSPKTFPSLEDRTFWFSGSLAEHLIWCLELASRFARARCAAYLEDFDTSLYLHNSMAARPSERAAQVGGARVCLHPNPAPEDIQFNESQVGQTKHLSESLHQGKPP